MAQIVKQLSTEGDDPVSQAIRAVQHSPAALPYTHVDIVMPDGMLLGARSDNGVKIRPPNYASFTHIHPVTIECSEKQAETYYAFAKAQVGKLYDYQAISAFLVPTLTRDWMDGHAWFCSELDAAAMFHAGIFPHDLATAVNKFTPFDDLIFSMGLAAYRRLGAA
jgi:hypothetical protein